MSPMPKQKRGRSKQNYQTPPEFLDAVRRYLQIDDFTIDLAASASNAVVGHYFSETHSAFDYDWQTWGGWGWLNPPYADIRPWVERAYHQSQSSYAPRIAMLLPAGVGANWWRDWVHGRCQVLLLNGRITFVGTDAPYPKDCVLLLYDRDRAPSYDVWTWMDQP